MSMPFQRPHPRCTRYAPLRRALTLLVAVAAVQASAASAAITTSAVAGPDAGLVGVGNVALANDGSGAMVYVDSDVTGTHVWLDELVGGSWQAPQRLDAGQDPTSSQPMVGVDDNGGLTAGWVNDGRLYAVTRATYGVPMSPPTLVYSAPSGIEVANPSVSMSLNGVGYIAFTTATATGGGSITPPLVSLLTGSNAVAQPTLSAGEVRVARFDRHSWSVVNGSININAADSAGLDAGRPDALALADGTAIVAWGETINGASQVFERRITRLTPSAYPEQASIASLQGHNGEDADSPVLSAEEDANYAWIAFRQDFDDGGAPHSRVLARALVGDELQTPVAVDGLAFGSGDAADAPALTVDLHGIGFAAAETQAAHAVVGDHLNSDATWGPGARIDSLPNTIAPRPVVASSSFDNDVVAWEDSGGGGEVRARYAAVVGVFGPETVVSNPALGAVDPAGGLTTAMDADGDFAVAFVQGTGVGRRLVAAVDAQAPTAPHLHRSPVFSRTGHPTFLWGQSSENWGPIVYQVNVNGRAVARTPGLSVTTLVRLAQGVDSFQVLAINARGDAAPSATGRLIVIRTPPRLGVSVGGARRAGALVRLVLHVVDHVPGAIQSPAAIRWGDGTVTVAKRVATHRYKAPGHYQVQVAVRDVAGNRAVKTFTLAIA